MNAKDVRIGNIVNYGIVPVTITGIHTQKLFQKDGEAIQDHFYVSNFAKGNRYYGVEEYDLEPIPLTPKLLLKFGFENQHYEYCDGYKIGDFIFTFIPDGDTEFRVEYEKISLFLCRPKYLHQLQNIYYSLTGKELTVNYIIQ